MWFFFFCFYLFLFIYLFFPFKCDLLNNFKLGRWNILTLYYFLVLAGIWSQMFFNWLATLVTLCLRIWLQCSRHRNLGLIPGLGRSPGGGHGNPLQYTYLENPMDREARRAIVDRVAQSQTRVKHLSKQHIFNWQVSLVAQGRSSGEGNGNSLQYSCLEISLDRGAWWSTVHGVSRLSI